MTNYHLTPPTILPSTATQEAHEKRRDVLAAARNTRWENYKRFNRKMQAQSHATA